MDRSVPRRADRRIAEGCYPSRSRAIRDAVRRHAERTRRRRLAEATARLDPQEEGTLAEEDLAGDAWPEFLIRTLSGDPMAEGEGFEPPRQLPA
jgi:Arc/MetJ-type ribon-helix-helix transcriptional regulator